MASRKPKPLEGEPAGKSDGRKADGPSRAEIASQRRRELIEATNESIAELGIGESSIERITERAGVSRGLIRHYFRTKDALLCEAYQSIWDQFRSDLEIVSSSYPKDPTSQLKAWFHTTFRPPYYNAGTLSAWLGYSQAARTDNGLKSINRVVYAWYRDYLGGLIGKAAADRGLGDDVGRLTDGLIALMDGLWLELTIDPEEFDPAYAESICIDYLARSLREPEAQGDASCP